jgi:hypothetical protein
MSCAGITVTLTIASQGSCPPSIEHLADTAGSKRLPYQEAEAVCQLSSSHLASLADPQASAVVASRLLAMASPPKIIWIGQYIDCLWTGPDLPHQGSLCSKFNAYFGHFASICRA